MKQPDLDSLSSLYALKPAVHLVAVECTQLLKFSRAVSNLFSSLGEQRQSVFWMEIIPRLRKYRYEISVLPLPFNSPTVWPEGLPEQLTQTLKTCVTGFPEQVDNLKQVLNTINALPASVHPIMQWICMKFPDGLENLQPINICLPRARYIPMVENYLEEQTLTRRRFNLITPVQLKHIQFYDHILFCGTTAVYSRNQLCDREYVWRAPRSEKLYFISFSWIKDRFDPEPVFDHPNHQAHVAIHRETFPEMNAGYAGNDMNRKPSEITFDDIDLLPADWIPESESTSTSGSTEYDYLCNCRQIFLEDGSFMYKEEEGASRIVDFDPKIKTRKMDNRDLAPGVFLVVRTGGSGDSVAAVADMLMGKQAAAMRNKQAEWKIAFRKKLFNYSTLFEAAIKLLDYGSIRANEINIRNWRSEETIKPKDFRDFKAILNFSGISQGVEDYWHNAKSIFQMHVRAGHTISQLLYENMEQSRRSTLEKYGCLDFELPGITGKLSVIRIEAVAEATSGQPMSRVNRLFR